MRDIDTEMSLEDSTLQLKETLVLVTTVLILLVEKLPKKKKSRTIISWIQIKLNETQKMLSHKRMTMIGEQIIYYKILSRLYESFLSPA